MRRPVDVAFGVHTWTILIEHFAVQSQLFADAPTDFRSAMCPPGHHKEGRNTHGQRGKKVVLSLIVA
jgi:hypothetical protein